MLEKRTLAFAMLVLMIAFAGQAEAQVSLGIWPAKFDASVPFMQRYYTNIYLFNPGSRDANVSASFECKTCSEEFSFLGIKGSNTFFVDYVVYPEGMVVEKDTGVNVSKGFTFSVANPLITRQEIDVLGFKIPYFGLNIGKRTIEGEVQATSASSAASLTVTSRATMELEGMDPLILLLSVSVAIFSAALWFYRRHRKSEEALSSQRQTGT